MKIDKGNYQEFALDYLEDNMPDGEKMEFEKFLAQDENARNEVCSLASGIPVLDATEEIYPDKKSLYRKPSGGRKFLHRAVYPAGAAAAVLLAVLMLWRNDDTAVAVEEGAVPETSETAVAVNTETVAALSQKESMPTEPATDTVKPNFTQLPAQKGEEKPLPENKDIPEEPAEAKTSGAVAPAIPVRDTDGTGEDYQAPVMAETEAVISGYMLAEVEEDMAEAVAVTAQSVAVPEDIRISDGQELLTAVDPFAGMEQREDIRKEPLRKGLSALLRPVENMIPIDRFEDNDTKGVEIASLIRITKRTRKD